eukprot:m.428922 g.428922  ORF g.428922 m.428922 type:complete len:247 (-) comp16912_c0_seq1:755-1495(-)
MKIIPPCEGTAQVESVEEYLQTLRDLIADEPAEQGGVANEGATRGRTKHPRRGCAVRSATPKGGVSSSRAESVQRRKAEGSRPGSRRERRWVNWAALQPSEDDVALDASPLIAAPSSFAQLNRLAAVDEWEATPYDGADDSRAAPTPPVTSRIDRNLRPLVRKAPKDLVASIEETLIESFSEESSMVYLATADCWNRALLHAVSAHLGLVSASETVDGRRVTTISNPRDDFSPPKVRLGAPRCACA